MKLSLIPLFICLSICFCHSQNIDISYQNPSSINVGGDYEIFSFEIQNNSNNIIDENSLIQIHLPFGISYDSTLSESLFIGSETEDINNPIFTYYNVIEIGETINLNFKAYANCNLYESLLNETTLVKNIIKFSYSLNGINQESILYDDTDNYNISYRNVHLNLPLMLNNEMNQTLLFSNLIDTVNQELVITVPGNSLDFSSFNILVETNDYIEFIEVNEFSIDNASYNSSLLTIEEVIDVSNVLNIKFNSLDIDSNMLTFSSDIVIKLKLKYRAKLCFENDSQDIKYSSYINNCILSETIGDFEYVSKESNLSYSFIVDNNFNLCGDSSNVKYSISNPNDALTPVFDIHLLIKKFQFCDINNLFINDISLDPELYVSSNNSPIHLSAEHITDLLDLTDEDNDGYLDDLAPGASLTVSFDVVYSYPVDDSLFLINNILLETNFYSLNSECDTDYSLDDISGKLEIKDNNKNISLLFENDLDEGSSNLINLCFDRYKLDKYDILYNDSMILKADIEIPCGFILDNEFSPKFISQSGDELLVDYSISNIDNKQFLNIKVEEFYMFENQINSYGGCFEFSLSSDCANSLVCSNNDSLVKANIYGSFKECTDSNFNFGFVEKQIFLHCLPLDGIGSCPILTTDFSLLRSTYGKLDSDGTQINFIDIKNNDLPQINSKGAYACDVISAEIRGELYCGSINNEEFYGYIWYDHPDNFNFLEMVNVSFIDSLGNALPVDSFSVHSSDINKTVYEIRVSNKEINSGEKFGLIADFYVNKSINNNPLFPNVYSFNNFRGGFNLNNFPPLNPSHYGDDFEIYSLNYSTSITSEKASCSKNGFLQIYLKVSGGSSDDFPNEFREVLKFTNDLNLSIPGATNGDLSIISKPLLGFPAQGGGSTQIELEIEETSQGNYKIFYENNNWIALDKHRGNMYCQIVIPISLNDCEHDELEKADISFSYLKQAYSSLGDYDCKELITVNYNNRIASDGSGFQQEDLKLDIVNNYYQSVNNITRYKIDIVNTTSKKALYPWIKISYPGDKISVSNSSIQGYEIIDEIYEENQLLLKLMPINGNTVMEGYIDVILNDCALTNEILDIEIETGISCTDIDENILIEDNKLCALDYNKKIQLEIIKSNLRMDVIPLFNDNASLAYCESFQYVIQIFNNEKANINNANFKVDVPEGFDMEIQYLYPITQTIDPNNFSFSDTNFSSQFTIQNNEYWELEDTNGVLPGYIANEGEQMFNYYQLLATFTPNCDYDGISPIEFSAKGVTNCNDVKAITFQSTPKFTRLENINNYTQDLSLTIEEIQGSSSYLATINYSTNTIIEELTGEIKINLPSGVYSSDNLN
ncbi:hypothetical protein OAX11_04695, partial [Flavobacteriaceae bacterium]|nr:hypothetical protein [Flavobacteriaceae bacterium]